MASKYRARWRKCSSGPHERYKERKKSYFENFERCNRKLRSVKIASYEEQEQEKEQAQQELKDCATALLE